MKIGQRLAFRFTLVSALLTGAILIITYVITQGVVHSDFRERLEQQSRLEVIHYATPNTREVVDHGSYLLVHPLIKIFSHEGNLLYEYGDFSVPSSWISFLQSKTLFNAERGNTSTVGRKYTIEDKTYLVFVSANDVAGNHELAILMKAMIAGWGVSIVLAYLLGLYFSSNALQPVKHVVNDVNKITEDNLGYRLKLDKDLSQVDEIDELILTFNALLNRIENAFIAQKRFVQHASHELRTPLTAIMAEAELALSRDRNVDDYKRTLTVVLDETERLVRITHGLLNLARLEERTFQSDLEEINITEVCSSAITSVRMHYPDRTIKENVPTTGAFVSGNRELLEIAVVNIIDNAIKYSDHDIILDVNKNSREVSISISDTGIGIPESDLAKIKSPLYRASNVSNVQGAGLGLSLVDRIVSLHNGRFEIQSSQEKGTTCLIFLKLA